jgi:hypothetical protein
MQADLDSVALLEEIFEGDPQCSGPKIYITTPNKDPHKAELRIYAECPGCAKTNVFFLCLNCLLWVSSRMLKHTPGCEYRGHVNEFYIKVEQL